MGVITTKNKRAEKLTDLAGENSLQLLEVLLTGLDPSLQRVCSSAPISVVLFLTLTPPPPGNPKKHITALKKAVDSACVGEPSLYNALNLAVQTLK